MELKRVNSVGNGHLRQPAACCSALPWRRATLWARWCAVGNPDAALRGFSSWRTLRVVPDPYAALRSGARPAAKKSRRPREDQSVRPGYVSKRRRNNERRRRLVCRLSVVAEYDDDQRPTSLRSLGRNVNRPWNGSAVSPSVPIRQLFDLLKSFWPNGASQIVTGGRWSGWLEVLFEKSAHTDSIEFSFYPIVHIALNFIRDDQCARDG